jgi:hypothetical protein
MTDGEYQEQAPPAQYGTPHPATETYVVAAKNNGLAIASLVLGILWIYWIGSILVLVFGYMAKNQIDRSGGTQSGRGLAVAGIVLGWVGIAILVLGTFAGIALILMGFGSS